MSILDLLARVTARRADAVALEDLAQRLTYAELDGRSNVIARRLESMGIGPEQLVGICTRPSVDTIVAMLGVLATGAAFVVLDISYPAQRLASMIADSAVRCVVVDPACHNAPVLAGLEQLVIGREVEAHVRVPIVDDQLAYVVFTSGSTGRPKGVAVTHAGIMNLVERQIEAFQIDADSRVLQFAALGFDAVISEAFTALGAGATLCLEERNAAHDVHEILARRRISVVTMPPSLLRILRTDELPALRTVVSAGEACTPEIVKRWAGSRRMINAYGPSECTVCATLKLMTGPDDSPTIGRAMGGVETYVLDPALASVAPGEIGELYLASTALARGYIGQPGLTAERFVPDPFTADGARMYRTGDLVRRQANGELEYLGRSDDQVKVRGFRVEPREVEAVLRELPGVDDVVVLPRTRSSGEVTLIPYIVSRASKVRESELRDFVRTRLPHFLRPSEFVMLTEWPMSPNGKIDRAALAQLRQAQSVDVVPARTATEQTIERVVKTLLDQSWVDLDRSFFDQGGDSIAAVRFAIALAGAFKRPIPIGTLFECPTLRALAERIDTTTATAAAILTLRDGNAGSRIWLTAPVHGNALCYLQFASLLPRDVLCSGLQTPGVDGEQAPLDDFVALAAHQVRKLRHEQPHGPYVLGGWSMGGSLAFEMAVQLEQVGEVVSHLVLIGATAPSPDHLEGARATMKDYEMWRIAYFYLRSLAFSLGIPLAIDFAEWSQLPADHVFGRFIATVRTLGPLGADIDEDLARRWLGIVRANLYGFQHQVPSGRFGGRTLIVRATGANPLNTDDLLRRRAVAPGTWDDLLAGPVDVSPVAANHYTLMQPPWVEEVASVIGGWFRSTAAFRREPT